MRKNFNLATLKQPQIAVRIALGILLLANVILAIVVFKPFGGSRQDLENQLIGLQNQVKTRQANLARIRLLATKVDKGRNEGDNFVGQQFLMRRTAYSSLLSELVGMAKSTGIRPKEFSYIYQPIEGSEDMAMLTITGNYEGTYADLVHLLNMIDRSPRFMILEYLQAAPQATSGVLMINMKINTFVRDDGSGPMDAPTGVKEQAE